MAFWYLLNVPGQCQHGGIEPSLPILFLNKLFSHSNTQAPWFYPSNLSKKMMFISEFHPGMDWKWLSASSS